MVNNQSWEGMDPSLSLFPRGIDWEGDWQYGLLPFG